MESAIPAHLAGPRTLPARMRGGWTPPYPSYVARMQPRIRQVVMAYFGLQPRGEPPAAALADLAAAFAAADGPGHHEVATDGADVVAIAYWDDPARYDRWATAHREPWLGAGDGCGRWAEVLRVGVHEHETLFSSLGRPEGVAALAAGMSGEVAEHGYWGGMRDRIPLSATDPLEPAGSPVVERDADRVRIRPHGGICLIRSGQDWTEPVLRAGMDFLATEGRRIGCYANRYLTVVRDGGPVERTFGMSWWRSLADLERWAESHPTHVAIFGAAMRYLSTLGPSARLRLYHEVSVVAEGDAVFEYVGCRPGTGLLGALPG
ncbi:MAG TPA: phenylacetaldoxime dehydratase family protein [Pseudonocardia sp.]|uniref:phenylacetaldoxime dehydratase family protein n=1 Tax=Pseudonocardia sp. TaxID=60912 RepID=UPI002B4B08F9|nr:phenylacetaldoxime dehydratase family protein [Pseudonocardia sp.]HLU56849.1 phenylacetaldoxime dehydratase family protein [Pseudonocardia sp.]